MEVEFGWVRNKGVAISQQEVAEMHRFHMELQGMLEHIIGRMCDGRKCSPDAHDVFAVPLVRGNVVLATESFQFRTSISFHTRKQSRPEP